MAKLGKSTTYAQHPGYLKERAEHLARSKGGRAAIPAALTKWERGIPTIMYSREGYGWEQGKYVKLTPRASGITHRYTTNRRENRAYAGDARRRARRAWRRDLEDRRQRWLQRDSTFHVSAEVKG